MNLKSQTFYINIKTQNKQHEVREARVVSLVSTFDDIHFSRLLTDKYPVINYVKPTELELEVAGMGLVGLSQIYAMCGVLYLSEEDACALNGNYIFRHGDLSTGSFSLKWAGIALDDLQVRSRAFSLVQSSGTSYINYYAKSWYWDGTKACGKRFGDKFQYDFATDSVVEYPNNESEYNKYKLYATKEMCERDNKPTIVRFESRPKEVEKIVTFEITLGVRVGAGCSEDDAISTAMDRLRTCDDEVLYGACVSCTDYPVR